MEETFKNWIEKLNGSENVSDEISAVNFGIIESENSYILYLTGSEVYDEDNDDWASEIDYEPSIKYLEITNSKIENWEVIQEQVEKIVSDFVNSEKFETSFLKDIKNITTGFDDGDLTKIK